MPGACSLCFPPSHPLSTQDRWAAPRPPRVLLGPQPPATGAGLFQTLREITTAAPADGNVPAGQRPGEWAPPSYRPVQALALGTPRARGALSVLLGGLPTTCQARCRHKWRLSNRGEALGECGPRCRVPGGKTGRTASLRAVAGGAEAIPAPSTSTHRGWPHMCCSPALPTLPTLAFAAQ